MNQFDACKVLGLKGRITPRHVISAYTKLGQNHLSSKHRMREINTAFSVMRDFQGPILNKTKIR